MTCIHRDGKQYPTAEVTMSMPEAATTLVVEDRVGMVDNLPVQC